MQNNFDVLIIGAGLSGVVMAEQFANIGKKILIIDKRDHIGGNCYDYIDKDTNIRVNKYGAHIFHTNSERVWNYVNKYSKWIRWDHEVIGIIDDTLVQIPVNINTVNKICNQNIHTENEMNEWLEKNQIKYNNINNSEDIAKSRVGEELYNKIFKDYTYKQWNKYPEELDSSVLARIPIRNNFDNRYFTDKYQALPENGYTEFIDNIIKSNDRIQVNLNCDFFEFKKSNDITNKIIIYTGPIDRYFIDSGLPKLEYRSIEFIEEKYFNMNYYQSNSVVNYPEIIYPFTRIVEYKHFLNQKSDHTIIYKEITNSNGDPYYPVPNKNNIELYESYKLLAENEKNVHFLGRLASYKYFNMDQTILNALEYFDRKFEKNLVNENKSIKYIIARYNEDISWLDSIKKDCIIINKGEPLNIDNEILCDNVGRESDSYLYYIITNYDNLPHVCVFSQGKIDDHFINNWTDHPPIFWNGLPVDYLKLIGQEAIQFDISKPRIVNNDINNAFFGPKWNCNNNDYYMGDNCYKNKKYILFIDWFEKNINPVFPKNNMIIYVNGLFAIKRELILKNKKEYYEKLITEVNWHNNPIEGHFFERSWYYIFNRD